MTLIPPVGAAMSRTKFTVVCAALPAASRAEMISDVGAVVFVVANVWVSDCQVAAVAVVPAAVKPVGAGGTVAAP